MYAYIYNDMTSKTFGWSMWGLGFVSGMCFGFVLVMVVYL